MNYQAIEGWFSWEPLYKRMVDYFPSGARFVEVGVWLGKSACYMAEQIKQSGKDIDFFCVDPWDVDVSGIPVRQSGGSFFPAFLTNAKDCGVRGHIIPVTLRSEHAAKHFQSHPLDFVFIDAEHDYDSVTNDIRIWRGLMRPGAFMGGHDYTLNQDTKRAVDDAFGNLVQVEGECWLVNV